MVDSWELLVCHRLLLLGAPPQTTLKIRVYRPFFQNLSHLEAPDVDRAVAVSLDQAGS